MSWRFMLRTVVRASLVLSVALSGMTFAADDAEARRGGKVRTTKERTSDHDSTTTKSKSDESHDAHGADGSPGGVYVPRVRSREAARGDAATATDADGQLPPRRRTSRARAMSVKPIEDIEVPGCPTGKMCTVCLAGCTAEIGGIVDAQVKTPPPKPRH